MLGLFALGFAFITLPVALCVGATDEIANTPPDASACALFPWGDPQCTDGSSNAHPRPDWVLAACMDGGLWITNDTWYGWQPALGDWQPDLSTNRLLIQLDRIVVSNNLTIAVTASGDPDAGILAGFYDHELLAVSEPILLFAASAILHTNSVDLSQMPSASIIALSATNGMMRIYNTILSRSDATSVTSPVEPPPLTSALCPPTFGLAGDGCGRLTTTVKPSTVIRPQASATPTTWHVNATSGSDSYDGSAESFVPATAKGPKQTIAAALSTANSGDTIYVAPGIYNKTIKLNNVRMVTKGRVVLQ